MHDSTTRNLRASPVVGRLLYEKPDGSLWACTATILTRNSIVRNNLLNTAGHCIFEDGQWHRNFLFQPNYYNGPVGGEWVVFRWGVPSAWVDSESYTMDYGFMSVHEKQQPDGTWKDIGDIFGSAGLTVNGPFEFHTATFGYPQEPPFDGSKQWYCEGETARLVDTVALSCDMTGGASGGPWFWGYNNDIGIGYIRSDTSFAMSGPTGIFANGGPYYSSETVGVTYQQYIEGGS